MLYWIVCDAEMCGYQFLFKYAYDLIIQEQHVCV